MPYDILQGVKYDPRYDDQNFALIAQGLDEANKRYDIAEASISDALAQYGAIPAVKEDRPFLTKRLDQFSQDINEMVNKKYAGDYGAASKEIARRIKQEHPYFSSAKQTYENYQRISPMVQKLKAEGKLVTRQGQDPLGKGTFGANGEILGTPEYEFYERGPYEEWIAKNYSQAFQNEVTENAPKFTGQSPYAVAQKLRGLSDETIAKRIGDNDAKKFLEDNKVFAIEYNLDPNKAEDLKVAKDYLVKTAQSQVATQIDNQYLLDKQWELNAEEAARRKALEETTTTPKLTRLYSTSVVGDSQDLEDVSLTDTSFKGQMKKDFIKSRWNDANGNLNPAAFAGKLNEYNTVLKKQQRNPKTGAIELVPTTKVSLLDVLQKDSVGQIDVDATLAEIEQLSKMVGGLEDTKGDPILMQKISLAKNFMKDMNTHTKQKMSQKFGDYGVDVMGFDLTDKNSAQTYSQMNDYINQISPDVFNFETGKFADVKTKKLSKNKDFLNARQDNKFKIQGVIKGADGDIKYIAEDGSGEPQVVSSNSDVVNRNLLRMFGSSDLIANFEYKNFKLSPSGNTVVYKDPNSGQEQRSKLKEGYKVERLSNGKYHLKNAQGNTFKENGQPREFDKWEIIHNVGIEEEK